jgi:hypothetical protein
MSGKPNDPPPSRLASGPQLWRLNPLGRLRLVDDALPINSSEAKLTIGAELERLDLSRFPRQARRSSGSPDSTRRDPTRPRPSRPGGEGRTRDRSAGVPCHLPARPSRAFPRARVTMPDRSWATGLPPRASPAWVCSAGAGGPNARTTGWSPGARSTRGTRLRPRARAFVRVHAWVATSDCGEQAPS